MNRSEARTLVNVMLNQNSTDVQWSPEELNIFIREANKEVYAKVMEQDDSFFVRTVSGTFPAGSPFVDISTNDWCNGQPESLIMVQQTPNPGIPGSNNAGYPIDEAPGGYQNLAVYNLTPLTANYGYRQYKYALLGDNLYLMPVPGGDVYLTLTFTPSVPILDQIPNPDQAQLLNGKLLRLHEYVCAEAVVRALAARQENPGKSLEIVLAEGQVHLQQLKRGRQRHRSSVIRKAYAW